MGRERRCTFGISCFILEWFSNVAIRFLLSFFSYNIVIVFERCLLCWMPVKLFLSNWTMKKCFCPSMIHTFWSEPMYYGTPWIPDYRCWIPVFVIGTWILDSGFQSLVRFRIPWAVFRIPKPRVRGSTSKICPDSYFNKGTILKPSQIPYYHNITL